MTDPERYVVTHTIAAPPSAIFAVLTDPARHKDTEPGDWVRDAVDPQPITGTGQIFAMNMFFPKAGGHYVVHNLVNEFAPDRAIGWLPVVMPPFGTEFLTESLAALDRSVT